MDAAVKILRNFPLISPKWIVGVVFVLINSSTKNKFLKRVPFEHVKVFLIGPNSRCSGVEKDWPKPAAHRGCATTRNARDCTV